MKTASKSKPKSATPKHVAQLREMGACSKAIRFARKFKTLQSAWKACADVGWMQWLLNMTDTNIKHSTNYRFCKGCQFEERANRDGADYVRKRFPKAPKLN